MQGRICGFLTITPFVAIAVIGCSKTTPSSDPSAPGEVLSLDWTRTAALTVATDCDQAEAWIEDSVIAQMRLGVEANRRCVLTPDECGWYRGVGGEDFANDGAAPPEAGGAKDDQTPDEYSETNTQVDGVDEADRVKTDGQYVYVLSDRDLVVVKSWPAARTEELGRVALGTWASSFFTLEMSTVSSCDNARKKGSGMG